MQQAMAAGIEGSWDDCRAQIIPWGFGMDQISIPVLLMHGRRDKTVQFSHGQWLGAHIPGVEARLFDDEGHSTLRENRIGEVHAWLAARL
jgi:pimeloyl-ACP methyl ester carboxylesterase